jgi:transposase
VFAVNPLQAARFRDRHGVSGAKSDSGDAHALADMVRTDSHQLRPAAGDSPEAEGVKVLARTHKTMIWERTREVQRLRHQLREYFPAALEAFAGLDAPEALELPGKAPEPARAARLTRAQVSAALKRAGRRNITERATAILTALRSEQLAQPPALAAAYAAAVRALIAVITALNEQVKVLEQQVRDHFGRHPDAEIIVSQPGMGPVPGARVLAESGDDPRRYADGKARRNYAATSPVTRASGKRKVVAARFVHNDRLVDALNAQAFSALTASPGARAFYDQQRANGHGHNDAPPTGSSASSTAASKPAPSTTRTPPGATASKPSKPLDNLSPWDVHAAGTAQMICDPWGRSTCRSPSSAMWPKTVFRLRAHGCLGHSGSGQINCCITTMVAV